MTAASLNVSGGSEQPIYSSSTLDPSTLPARGLRTGDEAQHQPLDGSHPITEHVDEEIEPSPAEPAQHFSPESCLFCNHIASDLDSSLIHMSDIHGMTIPEPHLLAVDIETFVQYLHLIVFGYFECLSCGSQRGSVRAIQQHMFGKGHCQIDISGEDSEFRDFYDSASDQEEPEVGSSSLSSLRQDEESFSLPSGKTLYRRSSRIPRIYHPKDRLEQKTASSQIESLPLTSANTESQQLTKNEARNVSLMSQLSHLRENDRQSLLHLPTPQQRAVLATQQKQIDKTRRAERRMQSRVQGMGNKTLMKHFVNDVPGPRLG